MGPAFDDAVGPTARTTVWLDKTCVDQTNILGSLETRISSFLLQSKRVIASTLYWSCLLLVRLVRLRASDVVPRATASIGQT